MTKTSGSCFAVVLGVLLALLSHGTVAKASNVDLHGETHGIQWYLSGEENDPGNQISYDVWLSAQVVSTQHRVESAYQSIQPEWGGEENQWMWQASFGGIKLAPLNQNEFSLSFQFNSPAVQINQYTGVNYNHWEGEVPSNSGYASISLDPSRLNYCNASYGEWAEWDNPSRVHWYMNVTCHGDFGEGPQGLAAAEAVFGTGTPEPGSLALLTLGSLATLRRKR